MILRNLEEPTITVITSLNFKDPTPTMLILIFSSTFQLKFFLVHPFMAQATVHQSAHEQSNSAEEERQLFAADVYPLVTLVI